MSTDSRDEAIREAKRYVRDIVQNDWSFEFSAKPGAPPPTYPPNPDPTEVLEWRVREYDSSGSELEPQFSPVSSPGGDASCSEASAGSRRTERRRKRRRQMEEEMGWNEGLQTWVERRDAWSGALSREQVRTWEQKQQSLSASDAELQDTTTTSSSQDTDAQSFPASTTPHSIAVPATGESSNLASRTEAALTIAENEPPAAPGTSLELHNGQSPLPPSDQPTENLTTDPIPDLTDLPQPLSASSAIPTSSPSTSSTSTTTSDPSNPFHDPLIPVVPSLISTSNPIRASITPAMYPSIYSKVVIQGLTPTVPINLSDMTKAMVQGWKADGQWPPKPQNLVLPDNAIVRPSNASATKHPDTPAIPPAAGAGDSRDGRHPPSSPESKRKSGIASTVRKVLHFSGFHPHPFHRRGSSSQHNSHPEDLSVTSPGEGTGNGNSEHGGR
ncbi:hypothetical protein BJY04DRAFT_220514 [Aspergillus karnatakaensis]|uniref:uncharacterized protein n=1 Tax=Aspergillus karnatakaensis TaxID=1810916 RepID=UPI003CCD5EFE